MGELCEPNIYNISPQYLPTKIGRKNKIFYESAVSLFARILQTRVELRRGELASPSNRFVNVQRSSSAKILSKKLRHHFKKSVFAPTIFF